MDTSPKIPDETLTKQTQSMDVALLITAVLFGCYLDFAVLCDFVKHCQDFLNIYGLIKTEEFEFKISISVLFSAVSFKTSTFDKKSH